MRPCTERRSSVTAPALLDLLHPCSRVHTPQWSTEIHATAMEGVSVGFAGAKTDHPRHTVRPERRSSVTAPALLYLLHPCSRVHTPQWSTEIHATAMEGVSVGFAGAKTDHPRHTVRPERRSCASMHPRHTVRPEHKKSEALGFAFDIAFLWRTIQGRR